MILTVDWGNTRVKAGIFNSTGFLLQTFNFSHDEAVKNIAEIIEKENITQSLLSSVAQVPHVLIDFYINEPGFEILTLETPLPIINAYQTPESLGMDRLAAAVAAYKAHPDVDNLVISAGTAIVFNFITKSGIFRGGSIAPGVKMRLHAMHQYTENLPLVDNKGMTTLVGYDTESSMRTGAIIGAAAEIEGMIKYYKLQFPEINITITGGDASLLGLKFKNKIFADEHITLKGLYQIYKHNAQK